MEILHSQGPEHPIMSLGCSGMSGQAEVYGHGAQPCLTKLEQPCLPHTNSLILWVFGDNNILTELSFYLGFGFPVQWLLEVLWQL